MLISVIVTTFNREDALAAVLRSLASQQDSCFEILVADDGSSPATAMLVDQCKSQLGIPLTHVWHEHRGFRAGEIRNRAVHACSGDYLIFLDGDCLTPPDFVAMHRRLAEPGWFVTGNRALLTRALTEVVLSENLEPEHWGMMVWLRQRLNGGLNRLAPMLRLPLGLLRKVRPQTWEDARSCNLAVWRSDFKRVDGFDARFSGWGKEDSDLLVRLLHAGLRRKDGGFATGVVHLWHHEADRSQLSANEEKLRGVISGRHVRAERGMSTTDEGATRIADKSRFGGQDAADAAPIRGR